MSGDDGRTPPAEDGSTATPSVVKSLLILRERVIHTRCNLYISLLSSIEVVDDIASNMYVNQEQWRRALLGHSFSVSRPSCNDYRDSGTVVSILKNWLRSHEEAQVMFASVLVVIGLWWLVRTILTLMINLICPLLVVLLAVVCVPQLRSPLLGQNYPMLANLLRNILLKMAENIKTK